MRDTKSGQYFISCLKKKPEQYLFFTRLEHKTIKEIENFDAPKWIREHFLNLKKNNFVWSQEKEDQIVSPLDYTVTNTTVPQQTGTVYEYCGNDMTVKGLTKLNFVIEDKTTFIVWGTEIMVGSHRFRVKNEQSLRNLLDSCNYIGTMNNSEYYDYNQKYLNQKHRLTTSEEEPQQKSPIENSLGFRIIR
jgi:hypothetical protein